MTSALPARENVGLHTTLRESLLALVRALARSAALQEHQGLAQPSGANEHD